MMLSDLFPKGMRRRWWFFRPIDALVALCPAPRRKKGVLVVRMDGIGDMVMFRSALDHYPEALGVDAGEITVLGCNSWRSLAEFAFAGFNVVTIDEHAFEKKWLYRLKVALWVRRQGFRVAVCDIFWRKTMTSDSLVWMSRAEQRIVCQPLIADKTRAEFAWFLSKATRIIDTGTFPDQETIRHFRFLTALAGRPFPPETPRLPWPLRDSPIPDGKPYVVLNFGSNEPGRRWPLDKFLEIARRCLDLGLRVVFVGGRQEDFAKPHIAELDHPDVIDTVGQYPLPVLVDILRAAALVVTNDTGPAHLAFGVGAPVIEIVGGGNYGAFVPYPEEIRPTAAAFINKPMACYHCLWHCPKRTSSHAPFPCIAEIEVDEVWQAAVKILDR